MSDWTEAEYKAILTHKPQDPATKKITTIETNETVSNGIDWRTMGAVNPIKDQGQCGSCYAFSGVSASESAHFLASGTLLSFSEE